MSRFVILYRESVLYSYIEITAPFGVVLTISSGRILAFILKIRTTIIKLKLYSIIVIVSYIRRLSTLRIGVLRISLYRYSKLIP